MSKLTAVQKLFIYEYLVDLNATQAAIRAGYSEQSAGVIGYENLKKPQIAQAIQEQMDKRAEKIELTAERVLESILKIASVDIGDAYDKDGRLLPIHDIPKDIRKAISSIKVFEEFEGHGADRIKVGEVREVKFWDKIKSLELLGRHLALFTDNLKHSGDKEKPVNIKLENSEIMDLIRSARGEKPK